MMKGKPNLNSIKQFLFLFLCLAPFIGSAQIEITPANTGIFTPESLVTNVFLGDGVEVTNLNYSGADIAVGYFTNGLGDVGIERGILMTTGDATIAQGANNSGGNGFNNGSDNNACPALNNIATLGTFNTAFYTITFIPTADTLRFKYVFASEEYPEFACDDFNDVFGFFITGPNPAGGMYNQTNIALVPDPADPSGETFTNVPVTINNVNPNGVDVPNGCDYDYGAYYNNNAGSNTLEYDAYLDVFIAQAIVTPCEEYTMKLAVADVGDGIYDTGVFLEAKSFGTGTLEVEAATVSLDGTITEGCSDGVLSFTLPNDVPADFQIDYTIFGTAENGVDYEFIPGDLTIPAGENSISVPIIAFEDMLDESAESIGIDVQRDICNRDTFWIFIRDNEIVDPVLREDTTICSSNTVGLDGTLQIQLPPPPTFTFDGNIPLNFPEFTESEIQVFGVQPTFLDEGVIKRICIDTLIHGWDDDLLIYLIAPSGQFLELTTGNGANGDDYIGTCFTPNATTVITDGGPDPNSAPASEAPFTGDYLPEGVFSDLWDGENLTNGVWKLLIGDKFGVENGFLRNWSICFESIYQVEYVWSPTSGLDCWDCPDPNASPDVTTTYTLTATDSYGCSVYDSVTITVLDQLPAPVIDCTNITDNSITFIWDAISGASGGYEVSFDGGVSWEPANNGVLSHIADGLTLSTDVDIEVRAIGMCDGAIGTQQCSTPDCIPPTLTNDLVIDANCFGSSDGEIQVSGNGTYPPFTYTLDMVSNTTGTFTGLSAGVYEIFIDDDVSCSTSLSITVGQPDTITTAPITITDVNCFGESNGEISVAVNGGTYPYNFDWGPGQTDSIANGLPIGNYIVTITDNHGCIANQEVEIMQPDILSLSISADSLECFGMNDGVATPTFMGGTGPYDFVWSDGQTTTSATDLTAGTYSVVMTDFNQCTVSETITILEPTPIMSTTSATDASCFEFANGTSTINVSGGSGPYNYNWNGTQNSQIATDLAAGMQYVTISDANDCLHFDSVEVFQPIEMLAMIDSTDVLCNGGDNGTATVDVMGGTGTYDYEWMPSGQTTAIATGLTAGTQTVVVTDDNDCEISLSIDVNEPDAFDIQDNLSNVNCNTGTDGAIDITVSGGTNNFSFSWDNGEITEDLNGVVAGTYTVVVTDDNNCSSTATYTITEPAPLSFNNAISDANCYGGSDGTIDITPAGGSGMYSYLWDNGETTEDLTDLSEGFYTLTLTDGNMCTFEMELYVGQPIEPVTTNIPAADIICFGAADGVATVNVSGGTGPYTYEWSDGQTTQTATGLTANTYQVTVTDAGDCTYEDMIVIDQQAQISTTLSTTGALCNNGSEGTATVDDILYGGTSTNISDFNITWSNGQTGTEAINLVGGNTYTVTVTDQLNCIGTASVTIDNPPAMSAFITDRVDVVCNGDQTGLATVAGNGGTAPYNYLWSNNANSQTNETATNLGIGIYNVTITDINNCTSTTSVEILEPNRLLVDVEGIDILCKGEPQGTASSFVNGGTPPYFYEWSDGTTTQTNESIYAGIYEITITDGNDCTVINQIEITEPEEYLSVEEDHTHLSCWESGDGFIDIDPVGGTAPYTYSLDGITFGGADKIPGLDAGDYLVYVQDANGCIERLPDTVNIYQPLPIEVNTYPDQTILFGELGYLNSEVINNTGALDYFWSPADSLTCIDCPNPTAIGLQYQTSYTLTVIDENGCEGEDVHTIFVRQDRNVFVPTGFSPNGDGINDLLYVVGQEGVMIKAFNVFDRWGELVHQSLEFDINDGTIGWDGNFRSKEMPTGIYYWTAEVLYTDGTNGVHSGETTLLR